MEKEFIIYTKDAMKEVDKYLSDYKKYKTQEVKNRNEVYRNMSRQLSKRCK